MTLDWPGPGASISTGGASTSRFAEMPAWSLDIGGYGGTNVFTNSSDYAAGRPKFGFDLDFLYRLWEHFYVGAFVGVVDTPNGAIETFGGSTGSGVSLSGMHAGPLSGRVQPLGATGSTFGSYNVRRVDVPVGMRLQENFGRFGISEETGALPSFAKEVSESCFSGSSGGTSCDSSTIADQTIVGYTYGARVHYRFTNHLGAFVGYNRDGALKSYGSSSSYHIDFQSNEAYGGISYSWGW